MVEIKRLRWWMISLVMLGSAMNYLTRSTLAVAAPTVLQDLRIGEREYSWILGVFQGAIMLQPICGYVLDVIGLSDNTGARDLPPVLDSKRRLASALHLCPRDGRAGFLLHGLVAGGKLA